VPTDVNPAALADLVKGSTVPVLVDFWAPWCGPCRAMVPALTTLAGELTGRLSVVKLNVDQHPEVLGECHIQSIPTLILFAGGGGELARRVGALPLPGLREFVARAGVT
jgi:thioredoxin